MKKLGFGLMRLPLTDANDEKSVDLKVFCDMVDTFLDRGFNYFDTAYMYHGYQSEVFMKNALVDRYPRAAFQVADKMHMRYLKEDGQQERYFEEQLQKCGVDYFDSFLIHNLGAPNYEIAQRFSTFEYLEGQRAAGRIRRFGFSFHDTADVLERILSDHPNVDFVQLQLNYMDWEDKSIQSRLCHEVARKHGKPIIVMEPLKGGTLANVPPEAEALFLASRPELSMASWGIRFAASQEGVEMVLSGMSNLEQLLDNTSYMQDFEPMSEEELKLAYLAAEMIRASELISCTTCGYCMEDCPMNIPIPNYFALYNADKRSLNADFSIHEQYYENYLPSHGKAGDCIACGRCEAACPQHLPIIEWMKKVSENFDKHLR